MNADSPERAATAASAATAIAEHLAILADGLDAAAAAFPGSGTTGSSGPAAAALSRLLAVRPGEFRAVGRACRSAADALLTLANDLRQVAVLQLQARAAPAEAAVQIRQRAEQLGHTSAGQAAGTLLSLAASAPHRGNRFQRWTSRLDSWRSEILLGTDESAESLINAVTTTLSRVSRPDDVRAWSGDRDAVLGQVGAFGHPLELAQSVIDWDTWRSDPPRAVGHLLPDLTLALIGGAAAGSARDLQVAARSRSAVTAAAARDALRREAGRAGVRSARESLLRISDTPAPAAKAWRGDGGTRLSAEQNAFAEAFHALSSVGEPSLTATMQQVSREADAELAGLGHRVKDLDSLKRKLATEHARTGRPLPVLLNRAEDAVRYTVVIDNAAYTRGVSQVAALLERRGYVNVRISNAWRSSRYRGINTNWADPESGAVFEVQFHTPASWKATRETHAQYEEYRLPTTSRARKAALSRSIAQAYGQATVPEQVESLTRFTLPPPSAPEPIAMPVDYTVHAELGAAAVGRPAEHRGGLRAGPPEGRSIPS